MLPLENLPELERISKFIISRWQLDHNTALTVMQARCLGMDITREDYLRVVRAYCDVSTENKTVGNASDQLPKN